MFFCFLLFFYREFSWHVKSDKKTIIGYAASSGKEERKNMMMNMIMAAQTAQVEVLNALRELSIDSLLKNHTLKGVGVIVWDGIPCEYEYQVLDEVFVEMQLEKLHGEDRMHAVGNVIQTRAILQRWG